MVKSHLLQGYENPIETDEPGSSGQQKCYDPSIKIIGVDNKGVGLCNEAVPVQVRPFEVGGSRKTLPRPIPVVKVSA